MRLTPREALLILSASPQRTSHVSASSEDGVTWMDQTSVASPKKL